MGFQISKFTASSQRLAFSSPASPHRTGPWKSLILALGHSRVSTANRQLVGPIGTTEGNAEATEYFSNLVKRTISNGFSSVFKTATSTAPKLESHAQAQTQRNKQETTRSARSISLSTQLRKTR